MTATRYLEWARRSYTSGWSELLQRTSEFLPRFRQGPAVFRRFDDDTIYKAIIAEGSKVIAAFAEPVLDLLPAACASEVENQYQPGRIDIGEISFFNWVNALACCGYPDYTNHLAGRLSRIQTHPVHGPHWHYPRGFAALAFGVPEVYRPLAGVGVDESLAFTDGDLVGFNNQALLRHLAAAVEHKVSFESVRPAWSELVRRMDGEEETGTLSAGSLFWVARVVWHQIGGHPLGGVGDFVHRSFVEAAADEAR